MGRLEEEARNARVELQKQRMTIFTSLPYQTFMVHAIKAPAIESLMLLISPEAGKADKFKALLQLRKALKAFDEKFPEPTEENTWHPNSHRLIRIRDEFFKHCHLDESRQKLLRLGTNFVIVIYDYDPPYRMMIDWWARMLEIQNWDFDVPLSTIKRNWEWWHE